MTIKKNSFILLHVVSSFQKLFIEETLLSPLYGLGTFVKN